ncbi:MAG: hypothetical protein J4G04_07845 [Nitrosopumilaceae archaeon]|nr:hypothetical protein [Nitrosopumilaceae archaeon]
MVLTERERLIISVANALTIYAIKRSENSIPLSTTPHRFVLDAIPESMRGGLTADTVDEVFTSLSGAQSPPNGS